MVIIAPQNEPIPGNCSTQCGKYFEIPFQYFEISISGKGFGVESQAGDEDVQV